MTTLLFISRVHDPAPWVNVFRRLDPELRVRVWPDTGPVEAVDAVLAWTPPPGFLASLPNLRLISSFGAGIEHILADTKLPPSVPVTRIVEERLTRGMSEYVVLHVLRHHRKLDLIQANQRAGRWKWLPPADTPRTAVGIMGLGAMGAAATKLAPLTMPALGATGTVVADGATPPSMVMRSVGNGERSARGAPTVLSAPCQSVGGDSNVSVKRAQVDVI